MICRFTPSSKLLAVVLLLVHSLAWLLSRTRSRYLGGCLRHIHIMSQPPNFVPAPDKSLWLQSRRLTLQRG
ncbi:hypothetical protein JAAARDRAFT_238813 [Jaapia argillacea MUCL 33604]|uniref:Uncharacterized protein n=1 Tax=Jaapia argillacea MUCL 33604 TaxID=933084 RepID=A0A067QCN0_9AGAM|nr:hypothetical protein JAAARDRAFT_238813 [Jaapia argillacea MUCL 33604]